jgi:uncharacterized membrane protein YvbJ
MFCQKCGKEMPDTFAFCGSCGHGVNAPIVQPSQPATTSSTTIAIGVFLGVIAVLIVVSVYADIGGVALLCGILAILAILVASGAFKKQLH